MGIKLVFHAKIDLWNMGLPLNEWFFGNMEAIYLSYQPILFWEHRSSLENVFGSWIVSAINEAMIERSVDLRSILVELLLVILVEVMEVDGVWTEIKVIERGDADVLVHWDLFRLSKYNIPWDFLWSLWDYFFWQRFQIFLSFFSDVVGSKIVSWFYKFKFWIIFVSDMIITTPLF